VNKQGIVAWLKRLKKARDTRYFIADYEGDGTYIADGYMLVRLTNFAFANEILLECGIAPLAPGGTHTHDGPGATVPNMPYLMEDARKETVAVELTRLAWYGLNTNTGKDYACRIFKPANLDMLIPEHSTPLAVDIALINVVGADVNALNAEFGWRAHADKVFAFEGDEPVALFMRMFLQNEGIKREAFRAFRLDLGTLPSQERPEPEDWRARIVRHKATGEIFIETPAEFWATQVQLHTLSGTHPAPLPVGHLAFTASGDWDYYERLDRDELFSMPVKDLVAPPAPAQTVVGPTPEGERAFVDFNFGEG
jgi:hypothetical protein